VVHFRLAALQGLVLGALGWILLRTLRRAGRSRIERYAAAALVLGNPVLLARSAELLTDFMSAVLLVVAAGLGYLAATRRPAQARGIAPLLRCGAPPGTAVMIRPGNLLCVAVLLALVAVSHLSPRRSVATVLLGTAFLLPMIPQSLANFRATRRLDPLTMRGMYATQVRYGLELAKYGTI